MEIPTSYNPRLLDSKTPKVPKPPKPPRPASQGSKTTWLTPICAVWEQHNGPGSFATIAAASTKPVKALLDAGNAIEKVAQHLDAYLGAKRPGEYRNITTFCQTFGQWEPKPLVVNGWLADEPYEKRA